MSRRSAEMNNIYKKIPKQLDDEIFEQLAENENVRIERIISKGHQSPTSGWYDQEQNEWVIVLRGEAVLSFKDGSSITLKKWATTSILMLIKSIRFRGLTQILKQYG